jgi:hypothetical protein
MKANLNLVLATHLILASTHGALAWTGNDVRNVGAIIVLGQRLICQDQPAGVWAYTQAYLENDEADLFKSGTRF